MFHKALFYYFGEPV